MTYQSLYRRYRPQTFGDMVGQEHLISALRNAVREDRVGHAYLFSGPRGTGKTTAARVLAKVLNCENPIDGEPDGVCASCVAIETGRSFDLHELDAASNNRVEHVRSLLEKVALGTPGRRKVYLLDEVHMLTPGAENALLKTLEEPPDHVVFVLATTEPHKVVQTIRSRTQQFELTLIPAEQMAARVYEIAADAEIEVDEEIVGHVVKVGGGSARDTLSALDQVIAAGGVADVDTSTPDLLEAVASQDPALALRSIEDATSRGMDPRRVGESFIDALRSVFLMKMGAPPARLSAPERELSESFAPRLSPGTITRVLELVGDALVEMRQAPDPRIDLEVAFVRAVSPGSDGSVDGLLARIEQLEHRLESGALSAPTPSPNQPVAALPSAQAAPATAPTASAPAPSVPASDTEQPVSEAPLEPAAPAPAEAPPQPAGESGRRPADAARAVLRSQSGDSRPATPSSASRPAPPSKRAGGPPVPPSMRDDAAPAAATPEAPTPAEQISTEPARAPSEVAPQSSAAPSSQAPVAEGVPPSEPEPSPAAPTGGVGFEQLRDGWVAMLDGQSTPARARFLAGHVAGVSGDVIDFVLPTESQVKRCESYRVEVEKAVAESFGTPMRIALRAGDQPAPAGSPSSSSSDPTTATSEVQDESEIDIHDLTDADSMNATVVERIADVFPGAEVLDGES